MDNGFSGPALGLNLAILLDQRRLIMTGSFAYHS